MKKCLIISGGDYSPIPGKITYDCCIACDKGYEYALRAQIVPDVVIGDFDSYEGDIYGDIAKVDTKINVMRHPVEKDDTDTMLAIKQAVSMGCDHIIIVCALGGRLDHTIANIQSMAYAASRGCVCELYSDKEYMKALSSPREHEIILEKKENTSLSLFSLSDKCTNLSIKGAKYETKGVTLTNDFPLGLGNSWVSDEVSVSFDQGTLLLVESAM